MKTILGALFLLVVAGCGGNAESGAGAELCTLYQEEMAENPQGIISVSVMPQIKERVSEADPATRRAFSDLITAAAANPYSSSTDPNAVNEKAAAVRSTCLAEHSVEIASP